jgi:hypothetical protein
LTKTQNPFRNTRRFAGPPYRTGAKDKHSKQKKRPRQEKTPGTTAEYLEYLRQQDAFDRMPHAAEALRSEGPCGLGGAHT